MTLSEIEKQIIEFLSKNFDKSYQDIISSIQKPERTVMRYLNKLNKEWLIIKSKKWKFVFYNISKIYKIQEYFEKPHFQRKVVKYDENFLQNYKPNQIFFLNQEQRQLLHNTIQDLPKINTLNYKNNIRQIENMLIDLSFASSNLEWNTYSYLDTEILIKYNEVADGKSKFETQMILNHKNAIEYIIEIKNQNIDMQNLLTLHRILSLELLPSDMIGKIRNSDVQIWWSTYIPLAGSQNLQREASLFLSIYNQIQDPFEQAVFSLIFISYFQLFHDCNKRTSRLFSNISLLKYWYPPLSLLQIKKKDYIDAILSVYELNNTELIANLFVQNYLLNYKRYIPILEN